ncbi:hypothetical protein QTN25_005782 [Entamoeba marina]
MLSFIEDVVISVRGIVVDKSERVKNIIHYFTFFGASLISKAIQLDAAYKSNTNTQPLLDVLSRDVLLFEQFILVYDITNILTDYDAQPFSRILIKLKTSSSNQSQIIKTFISFVLETFPNLFKSDFFQKPAVSLAHLSSQLRALFPFYKHVVTRMKTIFDYFGNTYPFLLIQLLFFSDIDSIYQKAYTLLASNPTPHAVSQIKVPLIFQLV